MTARIIDGRALAAALRSRLARQIAALPFRPGLAVVLVGDDPASAVYVRSKDRAAHEAGILVQLPLPAQIAAQAVIEAVDPGKDVDGFHPLNAGRLASGCRALVPCTPSGVMKLLAEAGVPLEGARALVLGRSTIVGRPVAMLLLAAHATVTIAHSRTRNLAAECRRADIVVAAAGRPELVRGDWIAPGAAVIDVGINRGRDGRLVGDVAFAEAVQVAGAITPVPGGVGPMTIACLLENTVSAALRRRARDQKSLQRPLTSQSP